MSVGKLAAVRRRPWQPARVYGVSGLIGDAGKQLSRRVGHHHSAAPRFETGNQSDLSLASPDLAPRKPEAIAVPQIGLAVVALQLLRQEDVLPLGHTVIGVVDLRVERVDNELSVNDNRLVLLVAVKEKPSAEPSHSPLTILVEHRVGPHASHAGRPLKLIAAFEPRGLLLQFEFCAAAQHADQQRANAATDGRKTAFVRRHSCHLAGILRFKGGSFPNSEH